VEIVDENGQLNESATASIIDFSITKNVIAIFISIAFILFIFISSAKSYASRKNKAPKGIQSVIEPFIILIRDEVAKPNIGDRYEKFMPFLLTLFFFIWINNLLGIIPFFPGGANVTGNISVALTLGLFAFIITTFSTNIHYWTHIINTPGVPWWLKFPVPLMPIVELIGVVSKPVVLTLRLFANITAGHIIILSFICLIFIFGKGGEAMGAGLGVSVASVLFSVFMDVMELLVAFLQAYVFTLLSAIYFGGAKVEHHHEEHH
jgi:F-type H+-transporting ATPase subunit a